jgi:hypothetical protein
VKDVKKLTKLITTEGGVAMNKAKLDQILRELGFEKTEDIYEPPYGEHFKIVYGINDYEVEVKGNPKENHFSNEGAVMVLEISFPVENSDILYKVEIYRVVKWELYIIHFWTGFEERYFAVYVWDKQKLQIISKLELNGGYIFVGSQKDLETLLPKLIKALDPAKIKIY